MLFVREACDAGDAGAASCGMLAVRGVDEGGAGLLVGIVSVYG